MWVELIKVEDGGGWGGVGDWVVGWKGIWGCWG